MKEQKLKFQDSIYFRHTETCIPFVEALKFLEVVAHQNSLNLCRYREFLIAKEVLDRSINYN